MYSVHVQEERKMAEDNGKSVWEKLDGEPSSAFHAFVLYRDFGTTRNIKKVLRENNLSEKSYRTWQRWSSLFDWKNRVEAYDAFCEEQQKEKQKLEEQERCARYRKMLDKMTNIVDSKIDAIEKSEINPMQTMELMERTWKLGTDINETEYPKPPEEQHEGQLQINFVDSFTGV